MPAHSLERSAERWIRCMRTVQDQSNSPVQCATAQGAGIHHRAEGMNIVEFMFVSVIILMTVAAILIVWGFYEAADFWGLGR